jgi:AcrR family transcriptional regulator
MPPRRDDRRRQELLDAVIATCARAGVGNRSLRELAEEVGTSHRMLIHHFGSRDQLMVAVVQEVERRQAIAFADLGSEPAEVVERMWAQVSDPALWPFERLFFECYARGAQGEEPFTMLLPSAVHSWLELAAHHPAGGDPAFNRLGLAVIRGLLLDLVATGDREAVGQALSRFAGLLGAGDQPAAVRSSRSSTRSSPNSNSSP